MSCVHLLHPQKEVMCGCHRQPDIKVKVQSIECFVLFFSADEDCVDAENMGNG